MLFWNLAHGEDVTTEIIDQALSAHVKILDYSCAQVMIHYLFIFLLYIIHIYSNIIIVGSRCSKNSLA